MNAFTTVYWKEVRENLRDRRTLINALITGPLLGPVMFIMLMNIMINQQLSKSDRPLSVPVIGASLAPNLVGALRGAGIDAAPALADAETAVREQRADVVVRISPAYAKAWSEGQAVHTGRGKVPCGSSRAACRPPRHGRCRWRSATRPRRSRARR